MGVLVTTRDQARGFRDPEADQALRKEKHLSVGDKYMPPEVVATATAGARSRG